MNDYDEFYTETLAKLYLKQGHTEKAVAVYQSLIGQYPDRHDLKEALSGIRTAIEEPKTSRQVFLGNLVYQWLRLLLYFKRHQGLDSLKNRVV